MAVMVQPQTRDSGAVVRHQLEMDEPQPLDGYSDVRGRGLCCSLSYAQGRFAQLTPHMGSIETAYAMALENAAIV
jgi:hypothetical protein